MKNSVYARFTLSLLLVLSLMSPITAVALGDAKKHFKQGMKHEAAEEWDKAVEQFVLAVNENPKNPEYKLHLQRALFNASQMYMRTGNTAAQQKAYEAAYNAFRKAYAYDPTNELAKSEMARMVRMQEAVKNGEDPEAKTDENGKVKYTQTSLRGNGTPVPDFQMPQRLEKMRDVPFPGGVDLQYIVKELAKDLDLNVLFDQESRLDNRRVKIELKNVTAAKALDYIFLQENLFFQKVGPRTILVATGNRRTNFQQLVLRTFYLANANPKDVKTVITSAIPAQPGRSQTIVIEDATTNSLTIRDTEENIRLFAKLIASLDKDRAEVVMDVAIYEVNKTDLLRLGNQIGGPGGANLNNLGGTNQFIGPSAGAFNTNVITSMAAGLLIPSSVISAFQSKGNTKLLASTQIHAFNNEDSSARIGQRVPVRTASFAPVATTGGNQNNNSFVGDVINYEQVGLTLKFKPIVFPNQDVQVAMEIESKDVAAGGTSDNPIFTERTIKGTARVQNNKTLLLASVAQDVESNGRAGLPVLGWIPIIGRLFATPTKDNRQVDIVIAVTPRVIRAPAILPEDEVERPTGSLATPTSGSLEAMIIQEEREEFLAAARRLPTTAKVQLPDRPVDSPAYVRTDSGSTPATTTPASGSDSQPATTAKSDGMAVNLVPIDTGIKTLQINPTSDTSVASGNGVQTAETSTPKVDLTFGGDLPVMKKGEKIRIPVLVKSTGPFRSAVLGLRFDEKQLAIRSVTFGDVFGMGVANTSASPFLNQGGRMYVSLSAADQTVAGAIGVLAYLEVEALSDGKPQLSLEKDVLNFLAADGRNIPVKF